MVDRLSTYGGGAKDRSLVDANPLLRPAEEAYTQQIVSVMGSLEGSAIAVGKKDVRWEPDHSMKEPLPTEGPLGATFYFGVDYPEGAGHRVRLTAQVDGSVDIFFSYPHVASVKNDKGETRAVEDTMIPLPTYLDSGSPDTREDVLSGSLFEQAHYAFRQAEPVRIP